VIASGDDKLVDEKLANETLSSSAEMFRSVPLVADAVAVTAAATVVSEFIAETNASRIVVKVSVAIKGAVETVLPLMFIDATSPTVNEPAKEN
jgi:hypothetical protein